MSPPTLLVSLLLSLTANGLASAFQQGSKIQELATATAIQIPEITVDDDLVRHSLADSAQYILDKFNEVQSMPSCNKIATSALLYSCSTLKGSIEHDDSNLTRGSDLFVQEEINIYAARLAICELHGAEFDVEGACRPFIPTERTAKKTGLREWLSQKGSSKSTPFFGYYDEITLANLDQCLKALQTSAVAWMSYSNNRQNAVVMCQAMQSEVDKDEQIHIGKILATTAATASSSMQDVVEQIKDFQPAFNELRAAMPQFQRDLAAGNQRQLDLIDEIWINTERVLTSFQDVESSVTGVRDEIKNANEETVSLNANLQTTKDISTGVHDLVAHAQVRMSDLSTDMVATKEITAYVNEMFEQKLIQELTKVTNNITLINELVPKILHGTEATLEQQTSIHREMIEQSREIHKQQGDTLAMAIQLNETFSTIFAGLPGLFELSEILRRLAESAIYCAFFNCYLWLTFRCFSLYTASGLVMFTMVLFFGPVDHCMHTVAVIAEMVHDSPLMLHMVLGGLVLISAIATLVHIITSRSRAAKRSQPYDPASPKFEMPEKWGV